MAFQLINAALITGQITGDQIADGAVSTVKIEAGAITSSLLAAGAVDTAAIAAGAVTSSQIAAAAAILGSQLANGTITGGNIDVGTITAGLLAAGIIVAGIVDGTVIEGAQIVADGTSGNFLAYSGAPAPGNLIASVSPADGIDGEGNAYLQGTWSYAYNATFNEYFACGIVSGAVGTGLAGLSFQTAATYAGPYSQQGSLAYEGGGVVGLAAVSKLEFFTPQAFFTGAALVGGSTPVTAAAFEVQGAAAVDSIEAIVSGAAETWHNLGTIASGWTVSGRARYKMLADSGLVLVEFYDLVPPSSKPTDGTAVWTAANGLPAGYRPVNTTRVPLYSSNIGSEIPAFEFFASGAIECYGLGGTTSNFMSGSALLSTV